MTLLKPLTSYKLNEQNLHQIFADLFQTRYQFTPEFNVRLNSEIWLPIELEVKIENSSDFESFWLKVLEDYYKIEKKHPSEFDRMDFELGDKLLQLYLQKPTVRYIWDNVHGDCYVMVDESEMITLASESLWKKKVIENEKSLRRFNFHEKTFTDLDNENFTLTSFEIDKFDKTLHLDFNYQNLYPVYFGVYNQTTEYGMNQVIFRSVAFCHDESMYQRTIDLFEQIQKVCTIILQPKNTEIKIEKEIHMTPFPMLLHDELSLVQNAVTSLINAGYKSNDIAEFFGKEPIIISNTIQRIRKREMETNKTFLKDRK